MTTRAGNGRIPWPRVAGTAAKGSLFSLYRHWALALFSLAAAFAIWFVIQDVENPRVRASFPLDGDLSIEVSAINAGNLIPTEEFFVAVDVEGREDDLAQLSADDFDATIDLKNVSAGTPTEVQVRVSSRRDGVRVLAVKPDSKVLVTLEPIEEDEFAVRLNPSGQLEAGFEISDQGIEPLTVKVSGLAALIADVATVDLDVNLGALQEGSFEVAGDLTARDANGGEIEVTISPSRASVTYTVAQTFVQRSLPVGLTYTGQVAPGYRIANIVIEPPVLSATGPANEFANLKQLVTEPIPLTNATSEIRRVQNIDVQGRNISPERRQVSVRIEIEQIQCGPTNPACPAVSLQIAPGFSNPPAGQFAQGSVSVLVRLSGPLLALQNLNPRDLVVSVNLGAPAGNGLYPVTVTVPPALTSLGIRAEPVDPIPVALGPNP